MSKTSVIDFTIGCDPELMLIDREGNLKSAIPVIKGTKHEPIILDGEKGMISHDNVMVEYGTPPAKTEEQWIEGHRHVLRELTKVTGAAGLVLVVRASAQFPGVELADEEAKVFGCDPDFNPYEMEVNEISPMAALSPFRTCGGHIHVGHQKVAEDLDTLVELAKAYDAFLTVPFMLLSRDPTSAARRALYGKAGAHRPKPYGLEYRAVDNYWVGSPDLARLAYRLTRDGLRAVIQGNLRGFDENGVRKAVNSGDLTAAQGIMNGLVRRQIAKDTAELLNQLQDTPQPDLYKAWGL